ncbi:MAG: carbohydrate-binding domain-containing protein [Prevotella sp.]|nr:carbohydrate-binding domain-containing protein [Prevotella sp.]
MKKMNLFWGSVMVLFAFAACSTGDWYDDSLSPTTSSTTSSVTTQSDDDNSKTTSIADNVITGVSSDGDVTSFTVAINKNAISESVNVDSEDDDYIENTSFGKTITITFSKSGTATVSGDDAGIVTINGNDVTATNNTENIIRYVLTGETNDGFFKLYSSKKQAIVLNGVSITNPDGAAINNQSKKRTFIVLNDGTKNYLTDGTNYSDATDNEDMKACFFSEGQLVFSGSGYLEVDANCKAGIRSDDYVRTMPKSNIFVDASSGNGIRGNDAVIVTGGVINVNVTGTADKGVSSDGEIRIDGGRTTILTSGGYEYDEDDKDYSACSGLKADSVVTINGGELNIMSTGTGGKGINCDDKININDGIIRIITTGKRQKDSKGSVSPKGIKADGNITVKGGQTQVRLEGSGDGTEGIESKGEIHIEAGTVESYSYDDAINSAGNLYIDGGYVYARSYNNDGIDANKNLYINGGVVVAEGAGQPECGLDAAEQYKAYINGGTVIAVGGGLQAIDSSSKQASIAVSAQMGTTIGVLDGSKAILAYTTPGSNTGTALMISSPSFKSGSSYTLRSGCDVTGGTSFYNLTTGCTIGSGSQSVDVTASTSISGSMGGMGGGGNFPGNGPGGGHW